MALHIASLNSGSNGNCYYVGNGTEAVLIDAGISCKETEKRMRNLNLRMESVKAIFITHEHIDHVKGVEILAGRYDIPVYITPATLRHSGTRPPAQLIRELKTSDNVHVGNLIVTPVPKNHDAVDPHSFVVASGGIRIGIFTDIGAWCSNVATEFSRCHAAFLEANYDDQMLENGRYPYHLKNRIKGDKGHLSNAQALDLFLQHRSPALTHLLLAHLSKDNNHPELARNTFLPHAGRVAIHVASRFVETPVYVIDGNFSTPATAAPRPVQATLF